jgi:hypothetical protein
MSYCRVDGANFCADGSLDSIGAPRGQHGNADLLPATMGAMPASSKPDTRLYVNVYIVVGQIVFVPDRVQDPKTAGEANAEYPREVPHVAPSIETAGLVLNQTCSDNPAQSPEHDRCVDKHDRQKHDRCHQHDEQRELAR